VINRKQIIDEQIQEMNSEKEKDFKYRIKNKLQGIASAQKEIDNAITRKLKMVQELHEIECEKLPENLLVGV